MSLRSMIPAFTACWIVPAAAQFGPHPPAAENARAKPVVETLDQTRLRIGGVTLDRKTREIRFPAKVNMRDGLLEFLIVHEQGKIHESLLATSISPTHLNLAFKLLRYPASPELYPLPGLPGDGFPDVDAATRAGARVDIELEWREPQSGTTWRLPANDWIQHAVKTTAMPPGPWVYGGSSIEDGIYMPENTGDIAAIYITNSAIINYPGADNRDDTVWLPYPKRVPEIGTDVTVIISPHPAKP
jgi:hypothetical protein